VAAPTASADGGRAFFVATNGSDANPGTKVRPWRTIQKAANTVPVGSTVEIRGGVYGERVVVRVSGAPGAWITFRNYDGEHVRIDGTGLGPYEGIAGLVAIDSRAYVAVQGLEIAHFHDLADSFVPAGVFVTGTARHIALRDLDVHDIRTATADAHGIAVYGTSGDSPHPRRDDRRQPRPRQPPGLQRVGRRQRQRARLGDHQQPHLAQRQQHRRRQRTGDHDRHPYVENAGNVVDGNDWWVVGAPPSKATWEWKKSPTTASGRIGGRRATTRTACWAIRCSATGGVRGQDR
jgi:hypothetical protein